MLFRLLADILELLNMNWYKLFYHDIKHGLLRKRNLVPIFQFVLLYWGYFLSSSAFGILPTVNDYLSYSFLGTIPLQNMISKEFRFPIVWFQIMLCPLYINIDYLLGDLHKSGEQILIRSGKRATWFFSKCCWNLCCSTAYFLSAFVVALTLAFISDQWAFDCTPELMFLLEVPYMGQPSMYETWVAAACKPWLTIATINILQMVLCLYMKPVYAFLHSFTILTISTFFESPYLLGNGAMVVRTLSSKARINDVYFMSLVLGVSIFLGCVRIKRFDFINGNNV